MEVTEVVPFCEELKTVENHGGVLVQLKVYSMYLSTIGTCINPLTALATSSMGASSLNLYTG